MIAPDAMLNQPSLETERLRLEPLGPQHFDGAWAALHDPESVRLTGTHATFTEEQIQGWLATRAEAGDRADWAVIRLADGAYLGEVVLNDLDADNETVGFRIALSGERAVGHGYGTEATRAVLRYAFETAGVHRVELEVVEFNARARRSYEKCGFVVEGVRREAWLWDGVRSDVISMAALRGSGR
jgi:RimJ/RimL family protein N-acetyltransferase